MTRAAGLQTNALFYGTDDPALKAASISFGKKASSDSSQTRPAEPFAASLAASRADFDSTASKLRAARPDNFFLQQESLNRHHAQSNSTIAARSADRRASVLSIGSTTTDDRGPTSSSEVAAILAARKYQSTAEDNHADKRGSVQNLRVILPDGYSDAGSVSRDPSPRQTILGSQAVTRTPREAAKVDGATVDSTPLDSARNLVKLFDNDSLQNPKARQKSTVPYILPKNLTLQAPTPTRPNQLSASLTAALLAADSKRSDLENASTAITSKANALTGGPTTSLIAARAVGNFDLPNSKSPSPALPKEPSNSFKTSTAIKPKVLRSSSSQTSASTSESVPEKPFPELLASPRYKDPFIPSNPADLNLTSRPNSRPSSTYFRKSSTSSLVSKTEDRKASENGVFEAGDSMRNAILASSLASSRAASPAVTPSLGQSPYEKLWLPLPQASPTRRLTPSPVKGMKSTMRSPPIQSSEDSSLSAKAKRSLMKKHPNKHHEGTRRRWMDSITENERKRYEGVWAGNRGLLLNPNTDTRKNSAFPGSDVSHIVLDLVVRDIWSRSRLPPQVLAEIWNLVNLTGLHALSRDEFVVGMWLIDQTLKGRKLPPKVTESVWKSVRRFGEIRDRAQQLL
jgi:hypothetical protein